MTVRIVADQDIAALDSAFGKLGELTLRPGRSICRADLMQADALVVRSTTSVNKDLLQGTPVRFVATATSGTDHVDRLYLQRAGIGFADAAGCNANAVVEYVVTALSLLERDRVVDLKTSPVGIIGAGQVGSRLAVRLLQLGAVVRAHDPLLDSSSQLELQNRGVSFCDLQTALSCPVISLHVPLTRSGDYPTWHLLNAGRLQGLSPGTVVINTSRGDVVDGVALRKCLKQGSRITAVLDVWENEPRPDPALVSLATIATPHIAGYSQKAKFNATLRTATALAEYFSLERPEAISLARQDGGRIDGALAGNDRFCAGVLSQVLDLPTLTRSFQFSAAVSDGRVFDDMRRQLASRQEFGAWQVVAADLDQDRKAVLEILGFQLA